MILNALKYTRYKGAPREWSIVGINGDYAYFENINLLVGKNASGKSRTLNVIREIASLLSGKINLKETISPAESFDLVFKNETHKYRYLLDFKDQKVITEILYVDNKIVLDRNKNISKTIDNESFSVNIQDFELIISSLDGKGNPYYESFVVWGQSLKNYLFANQIEKNKLVKSYTQINDEDPGNEAPDLLIYTFYKGQTLYGEAFITEIVSNMEELGYYITDIDIQEYKGKYGLSIEEDGEYTVSQKDMSQGMFRALSMFIMLTFARMSNMSVCLLIDDMGEGLDFDSSKRMMDIVIKKVNKSNMQFFMTSNDRQVMNQIPLRFWSVIGREHNKSIFYDYTNSKETFEDFRYTGLNNFDFLTTDFYCKGFGIIDEDENED